MQDLLLNMFLHSIMLLRTFNDIYGCEKLIWKSIPQLQEFGFLRKHLRSIWDSNNQNVKKHWVYFVIRISYIKRYTKNEFSIKDFFCKCDRICRKLRIWSQLLKKSLMENVIFCAVKKLSCHRCLIGRKYFSLAFFV